MDPKTKSDLMNYEIRRYNRTIDGIRRLQIKTHRIRFVKKFLLDREIVKQTRRHFDILNRICQ